MNEKQRAALIEMVRAVLAVGHIDMFTEFRAVRLLNRLQNPDPIRPRWRFA